MTKISRDLAQAVHVYSNGKQTFKVGEIWYDHAGNECFFRENGTISCRTVNNEPSETIQSEKDSCDFNLIYEKYARTGLMTNVRREAPRFGDFSSAVDFHEAVFRSQQAEESFMELDPKVRARFENDPGKLIDFLNDSSNRDEAIKLGLVNPSQTSVDVKVDVEPNKGDEPTKVG